MSDFKKMDKNINDIHKEKQAYELAKKWYQAGYCPSGNTIGDDLDRCHFYNDCYKCMITYALKEYENLPESVKEKKLQMK